MDEKYALRSPVSLWDPLNDLVPVYNHRFTPFYCTKFHNVAFSSRNSSLDDPVLQSRKLFWHLVQTEASESKSLQTLVRIPCCDCPITKHKPIR